MFFRVSRAKNFSRKHHNDPQSRGLRTGGEINVVFRTWGTFATCPARWNRAPLIYVSVLRTAREITVSFIPLTPPSPLRRGEEDAVNYFSNGPSYLSRDKTVERVSRPELRKRGVVPGQVLNEWDAKELAMCRRWREVFAGRPCRVSEWLL